MARAQSYAALRESHKELNMNTRQLAEDFGVGGTDVYLRTNIKWQHHSAPLHSDRRAEEFKKIST